MVRRGQCLQRAAQRVGVGVGFVCLVGWPVALLAQERTFTVTPTIRASSTVTDNVDLDPREEASSEVIFQVTPGFTATAQGNRVTGQASYRLRNLYYAQEDESNEATHLFSLNGDAELMEDFLFLDASGQRRQEALSLIDPGSLDNGVGEDQANEVTTLRASPYVTHRLGRFADVTVRYAHDRTHNDGDDARDQYTNRYSANLDSGSLFNRFFWNADYSRREVSLDGDADNSSSVEDSTLETISATAGWELSRYLRVFAKAGEDDNDVSSPNNDGRDGSFWNAGFNLSPSRNTSLEASWGERFSKEDRFSLDLQHRRRQTLLEASYQETVRTDLRDPSREGDVPSSSNSPVNTREAVSVSTEARASVALNLRRTEWTLAGFRIKRDFLQTAGDNANDERQIGAEGSLSWALGSSVNWQNSLRYAEVDVENGRDETLRTARTGLTRALGPNVNGSLSYRYQTRSADDPGREFSENAITATINMSF